MHWSSAEKVAAHVGVDPETIYKWITRKRIRAHKLGRAWKFLVSSADAWFMVGHSTLDGTTTATCDITERKPSRR